MCPGWERLISLCQGGKKQRPRERQETKVSWLAGQACEREPGQTGKDLAGSLRAEIGRT